MPASEGRPIVRRFVIKRHKVTTSTKNPWVLRDRSRPAYLGHFARFDLAVAAANRKLADERGYVPSVAEIRERMRPASIDVEADPEFARVVTARASIRERRA